METAAGLQTKTEAVGELWGLSQRTKQQHIMCSHPNGLLGALVLAGEE